MANHIIEVEKLTKRFGEFTAVDGISFSIKEGEIVGLLGPNGAGKTTTIHILLSLITASSGTITMFGKDFRTHREEILQKMNFSSTYTHFPWRLTVWENLYVTALLYSVKHAKEKTQEAIEDMGLGKVRNTQVGRLSSGWVTRVNLTRTFLNDPRLILFDEPTASLDPEAAASIRSEILKRQKNQKSTILWTSHNMAEVEEVCDRVIFLNKGKIIAEDTPQGLARRIKTCKVTFMVIDGKKKFLSIARSKWWSVTDQDRFMTVELMEKEIPNLLNTLSDESIEYNEISIEKPTLEDFFLNFSGVS